MACSIRKARRSKGPWLHSVSLASATCVRASIEVDLTESDEAKAKAQVERMCKDLLANTVIENYSYESIG